MVAAVIVDGVSKSFRLANDPMLSLKERVLGIGRKGHRDFHAVHPLSFEIAEGTTVGLLGHNGSGKSTLLKCIAGILTPTTGTVQIRGRLASLLELGAGFHPELSGRENVFINAAFLGIPRREITTRFDDIVSFSGLEQFIDEPVKHYSSGMYVRLGFAVAVNLEPDVLLVDEVLAVGDEVFQQKCIDRVRELQRNGTSIVVVSHSADTIRNVCDRAIVLDHGAVVADAEPGEAIRIFREHLHGAMAGIEHFLAGSPLEITGIEITSLDSGTPASADRPSIRSGDGIEVHVDFRSRTVVETAVIGFEIVDSSGRLMHSIDTNRLGQAPRRIGSSGRITIRTGPITLLDGEYAINVRILDPRANQMLGWSESQHGFAITSSDRATGLIALDVRFDNQENES